MKPVDEVLWHWPQLCLACGLAPTPGPDIRGICIDSRQVQAGDLFIALAGDPGPQFKSASNGARDGHDFIPAAIEAGASGLMVARHQAQSIPQLQVADTLDGLWCLGRAARQRMHGQVVGITGSSGKTTARQWVEGLLKAQGQTHASIGSFNNHWGVPLSLARMPATSDFGVFEIGMNHPGEIQPLAELVNMDVALVLNVLPAHLGYFDDLEGIRQEKLSICAGLKPEGSLVVLDTLPLDGVTAKHILRFGLSAAADVRGVPTYHADHTQVSVTVGERSWQYRLSAGGEHRVLTSLASFAVLLALGADLEAALACMPNLLMPTGRGNELVIRGVSLLDDSYNANPVSMSYALQSLANTNEGRQKVAILGEMLELGPASQTLHEALQADCDGLDGVITVGDGFQSWNRSQLGERFWGHVNSAADIDLNQLLEKLEPDAQILVKGSNRVFWVHGFVEQLRRALLEGSVVGDTGET